MDGYQLYFEGVIFGYWLFKLPVSLNGNIALTFEYSRNFIKRTVKQENKKVEFVFEIATERLSIFLTACGSTEIFCVFVKNRF